MGPRESIARLPNGAWPIVTGALARRARESGRTTLVLVRHPDRFLAELRPWLAGRPTSYLFAEIAISFLDRPPAVDAAVGRRLEALAALAPGGEPSVIVSSRRAAMRPTLARDVLASTAIELAPRGRADLNRLSAQLIDLGYTREPLVEEPGQFSVRGGILDIFPAAGRAPVRAEFFGDEIESLRLFDPGNQRSVMSVPRLTVRPGRELVLGPQRGARGVARIREAGGLEHLRGDVRAEWEDDLARLEAGSSFPGVEFYAAYLEPSLPTLFDHLPKDALVIDLEPERQLADIRELERETRTLTEAEAADHELPPGFRPPMVPGERLLAGEWERIRVTAGELEGGVDLGWRQPEPIVGRPTALN
ncbi:MAG TPA: hypothetical protein VIO86_06610, partial [Candidatus Dormibacteraeota bacterium]